MSTGRPTLSAVAELAGVSLSTASLVYSGAKPVSDATRAKVVEAADRLGYRGPDPVAASLRRGRSGVVGVMVGGRVVDVFRDPVTIATLGGLSETFDELGAGMMLVPGEPGSTPSPAERAGHLPLDAVVFGWCGAHDEHTVGLLRARGIPMVAIEGPHDPEVPIVDIEHRAASRGLARHLHDLGHRAVAVVTLPLRFDGREGVVDATREADGIMHDAAERLAGVRDVFGPDVLVVEAAHHGVDAGRRAGEVALDAGGVTAVVAQSDLLASGVVLVAQERGLEVPADLSVAGFDGVPTPWLGLELTTAAQPMEEKGRIAGRMVEALLAGERPDDVVLPVKVRLGDTTGPPA